MERNPYAPPVDVSGETIEMSTGVPGFPSISPEDAAVLAELDKLGNKQPSWWGAILILVVSLALFLGGASLAESWSRLLILIPVLAFHELGHYLAMRYFNYRNVQMFFIPFFGAAVTGQHYNVPGWKKAIVALAGPVPGIILALPVAVVGLILEQRPVIDLALMMLILNGFNLLPFLPLDGGWVAHGVLFVRHPALDAVFRVVAGLCLLGIAFLMGAWLLIGVAIFMLIGVPISWRLANIAHKLRESGLVAYSTDAQANEIPVPAALTILGELRPIMPPQAPPKLLAQQVAQIYSTLNAHPPGALATLAVLAVHTGCFLIAVIGWFLLLVLRGPGQ